MRGMPVVEPPDLQAVTDAGNETTNDIAVTSGAAVKFEGDSGDTEINFSSSRLNVVVNGSDSGYFT